jgi:diacyltrehalose acyltransferase
MRGRRFRWMVVGLLASGGAGLLALTSMMNAGFAYGSDESAIMGGTGNPLPDPGYITDVNSLCIDPTTPAFPGQPVFPGYTPNGLTTPEQFFPVTPSLGNLTFDQSVAAGVTDLNNAIMSTCAGDNLVVFGYSQSATIATDEMRNLMAPGSNPAPTAWPSC